MQAEPRGFAQEFKRVLTSPLLNLTVGLPSELLQRLLQLWILDLVSQATGQHAAACIVAQGTAFIASLVTTGLGQQWIWRTAKKVNPREKHMRCKQKDYLLDTPRRTPLSC